MQKREERLALDIAEMLAIEHNAVDYIMPSNVGPKDLFELFCADFEARYQEEKSQPWFDSIMSHYGIYFTFECGRIFGIRMERAKRRKGEAHGRIRGKQTSVEGTSITQQVGQTAIENNAMPALRQEWEAGLFKEGGAIWLQPIQGEDLWQADAEQSQNTRNPSAILPQPEHHFP